MLFRPSSLLVLVVLVIVLCVVVLMWLSGFGAPDVATEANPTPYFIEEHSKNPLP